MLIEDGSAYIPRYLNNINTAIAACRSPSDLCLLQAKRAGYLARHSHASEARKIIRKLRDGNAGYDPRLAGWLTLSEGLVPYFESLDNTSAKGKFAKSLTMAKIAGDDELKGVAAAWLATSQYATGETRASIDSLNLALEASAPTCTDARGRALLLLGDMLYWSGDALAARHWYRESRRYAVFDGDIAMQNIILFNTANYAVWALNVEDCKTAAAQPNWKITSLEVASARNLNSALRIYNLPTLIPNMEAELKVVQRKWSEAEEIYEAIILKLGDEGLQRAIPKAFAQRAWCRVNVNNAAGASSDIANSLLHASDCEDLDDLFVMHTRLADSYRLLNDRPKSEKHSEIAANCIGLFETLQRETLSLLDPIIQRLSKEENPV